MLTTGTLNHDGTTDRSLPRLFIAGEIGADRRPVLSTIRRFQYQLGAVVNHLRIMARDQHWRIPVEAILQFPARPKSCEIGIGFEIAQLFGFSVELRDPAQNAGAINQHRVVGVERNMRTLAASDCLEVPCADAVYQGATWNAYRAVVLLPAIQTIREHVIDDDAIELGGGLIRLR